MKAKAMKVGPIPILVLLLTVFTVRCIFSIPGIFGTKPSHNLTYVGGYPIVVVRRHPDSPSPSPDNETLIHPHSNTSSSNASTSSIPTPKHNESVVSVYPTPAAEQGVPRIDPVWKQLVGTLSKKDASREAKNALDGGLKAWAEVSKMMADEVKERRKNVGGKKLAGADAKCPYMVSTVNATALKSKEEREVPIPCGLILDSSITIVGTPAGSTGEFAFELVGSKLLGEAEEPIVFHFSVRLRGDRKTDRPVIVHNTWSSDDDWHEEQRCPRPPDLNPLTANLVDGVEVCNPEIGRNISRRSGPGSWKQLNGVEKDLDAVWFPFAEGYPFVATLVAGWDGFHISVNGKHSTAFKYRQSLEPWMITRMRFSGDLELKEVLVNGLPISDDASLIPDLKLLKAPKVAKNVTLFVGIFSSNSNFVRRMALRRTWMQYPSVRNGSVVVRFFVGLHQRKQVNKELWTEALTYGDIQLLPIVDLYNLITYKTLSICMYATTNLKPKYVMKTDDDTFVRVDAVLSAIHNSRHNDSILLGNIEFTNEPERDESNKWFVSLKEWESSTYPPWAHGPGYVFSTDIAKFVVEGHQKGVLKFFKLEDVAMGIWISKFKKEKSRRVDYVNDENFCHMSCEPGYIIAHYQNPGQMQCLWNHLMLGEVDVCCNNDI